MAHPDVTVLRGLRHGGSPWLLRAGDREVVLRVARADQAAETATEVAAMTYAASACGSGWFVMVPSGKKTGMKEAFVPGRRPGTSRRPATSGISDP